MKKRLSRSAKTFDYYSSSSSSSFSSVLLGNNGRGGGGRFTAATNTRSWSISAKQRVT